MWSDECQHAFNSIKTLLCSASVLMTPNLTNKFELEVDASAVGAGAMLLQEDKDEIAILSATFHASLTKSIIRQSRKKR